MSSFIEGVTQKGLGIGHDLGFPTINILYSGKDSGVFAARVFVDGAWRLAAVNLAGRPTVDDRTDLCEAFILDWGGEVDEGVEFKVELLEKIREIKKFKSLTDLKGQISKDVEFIKSCYTAQGNKS